MSDVIERVGESILQHGKNSDRIYLMKYRSADEKIVFSRMKELIRLEHYTKVFAKVSAIDLPAFLAEGFIMEAFVPGFFGGIQDGVFLSRFFSEKRCTAPTEALSALSSILKKPSNSDEKFDQRFLVRALHAEDVPEMIDIFKAVFENYPFPIFEPEFLKESMAEETFYFGVFEEEKLIAVSSAECDLKNQNAEMTDFAVLPEKRGQKLGSLLLEEMEIAMKKKGILTFYTIARLKSLGMNRTFQKANYRYGGTLISNTAISTGIESMNVWYKSATQNN